MKFKRTDRSLESISAYLDGELSESESRKLERLLQEDPAFYQEFKAMAQTRRLLRHAPRVSVPKNFTLTYAMLPQKRSFSLWVPIMSTSSLLAAAALVLTYVTNLIPIANPSLMQSSAAQDMPMSAAMEPAGEAEVAPTAEGETQSPMIIQWFDGMAMGKGGGGSDLNPAAQALTLSNEQPMMESAGESALPGTESLPEIEAYAAEAPAALASEAAPESVPESAAALTESAPAALTPEVPAAAPPVPMPEGTPTPSAEEAMTYAAPPAAATAVSPETPLQNPILGIAPAEKQGQIITDQSAAAPINEISEAARSQVNPQILGWVRSVLLIFSLLSGTIAFLLYRQKQL